MLLKDCPVSAALRAFGGKWKPLILNELKHGPVRFGQLRRRLPEVSHKVLIEQLKQLETTGLITRTLHREAILRSEYTFSALGETLKPALDSLADWGKGAKKRELKKTHGITEMRMPKQSPRQEDDFDRKTEAHHARPVSKQNG